MTTDTIRTDKLLRDLLERRASAARVDGLLAEIVQTAVVTPQRRPWIPRLRPIAIQRQWFALVPLVVAVAMLGVLAIAPTDPDPAASPTPSPSVSPEPSPTPTFPSIRGRGIDGPTLQAGRYVTSGFEPTLLVTVPDRLWAPVIDAERQLLLRAHLPGVAASANENDSVTLVTIANVYDNACVEGPDGSVPWTSGSEPAAFLDWLETEMSFDLGPRTSRTILGQPALEVEFIAPSLAHCRGGFLAITNAGPVNPFGSNPAGQRARYAVFELNGQTVLVGTWTTDPARRDAVWAAADAVLESLEIAP